MILEIIILPLILRSLKHINLFFTLRLAVTVRLRRAEDNRTAGWCELTVTGYLTEGLKLCTSYWTRTNKRLLRRQLLYHSAKDV